MKEFAGEASTFAVTRPLARRLTGVPEAFALAEAAIVPAAFLLGVLILASCVTSPTAIAFISTSVNAVDRIATSWSALAIDIAIAGLDAVCVVVRALLVLLL